MEKEANECDLNEIYLVYLKKKRRKKKMIMSKLREEKSYREIFFCFFSFGTVYRNIVEWILVLDESFLSSIFVRKVNCQGGENFVVKISTRNEKRC